MNLDWLPKALVPVVIVLVLRLFRRAAPAPNPVEAWEHEGTRQIPEPFPTGIIGGFMWLVGLLLVLSFFLLRWANHQWAAMDGPADLRLYKTAIIWCFLPGFAALAVPWPFTVWLLRALGRTEEAFRVTTDSNQRGGMDSYRVMKWLSIGVAGPIAIFTVLAIPMHMTISGSEMLIGHYAQITPERFQLSQARRAILVDGVRYRDGSFHPAKDLLIDFADGRRFHANAEGDGGTSVPPEVVNLLLAKTGLSPEHAQTEEDIPRANSR